MKKASVICEVSHSLPEKISVLWDLRNAYCRQHLNGPGGGGATAVMLLSSGHQWGTKEVCPEWDRVPVLLKQYLSPRKWWSWHHQTAGNRTSIHAAHPRSLWGLGADQFLVLWPEKSQALSEAPSTKRNNVKPNAKQFSLVKNKDVGISEKRIPGSKVHEGTGGKGTSRLNDALVMTLRCHQILTEVNFLVTNVPLSS